MTEHHDATLLTTSEVARKLRVDVETVRRWARSGKLRAIRLPSKQMRFLLSDVEAMTSPLAHQAVG
jgi:excisionase family DNA binding protein